MKRYLKIFLAIGFVAISHSAFSIEGWRVVSSFPEIEDTIFDVRTETLKLYDDYYFPAIYYPLNKDILDAVKPLKKQKNKDNVFVITYKKEFDSPRMINLDSTSVIFRVYAKNISSYTITITNTFNQKVEKHYDISYSGYQDYSIEPILTWVHSDSLINRHNFKLKSLVIKAIPASKKYDFAIGELKIIKMFFIKIDVLHPFFTFLKGSNAPIWKNVFNIKNEILLTEPFNPFDSNWGSSSFTFIKDSSCNSISDEKDLLIAVYEETLKWYHFYKERGLNKKQVMIDFQKIENDTALNNSLKLASRLSEFTRQFGDGHFSVTVPKDSVSTVYNKNAPSNVRLIELNNKIYIASVFDSTLFSKNLLGKEIIAIDRKIIKDNENLSRILDRPKGTDVLLHYSDNNRIDSVTIKNNITYSIPDNFKPKHCDFYVENHLAYFRINHFEEGVYLRILNHFEEINKSKGLIIDLRGNGGGGTMASHRLFSLFINKPSVYSNLLDYHNDRESVVVIPNNKFYINIPVVILIDNHTACESEAFAEAMRYNKKTILVGKDSTSGTYASVYSLGFPSNVKLKINTIDSQNILCNNKMIEGIGISPDIWVKDNNVNDLYPYQDKVRLIGAKILSY